MMIKGAIRTATGNAAKLAATIGRGVEVRWADAGDHWPGYHEDMTLRRGYWVGDDRQHDWVGLRKADVRDEAMERHCYDPETGDADVRWTA
jgi:hypothetical protein